LPEVCSLATHTWNFSELGRADKKSFVLGVDSKTKHSVFIGNFSLIEE
jgi:hypothetical protein